MDITSLTLWLRFLLWPALVVGFLAVLEFGQPSSGGFLTRVSAALVGYGVGTVVPYILSDEFLHTRFATISEKDGQIIIRFDSVKKKEFDTAKTIVWVFFVVGLICWFANQYLPERLMASQYPPMVRWFIWLTGPAYCFAVAGLLYVRMRKGPETKPDLTSETDPDLTKGAKQS